MSTQNHAAPLDQSPETSTLDPIERAKKSWQAYLYRADAIIRDVFKGVFTFARTEYLPAFPLNGATGGAGGREARTVQVIPPTRKRRDGEQVDEHSGLVMVGGEERVIQHPDQVTYTVLLAPIQFANAQERAKGVDARPRSGRDIIEDLLYVHCGAAAHNLTNSGNPRGMVLNRTFQNIATRVGWTTGRDGKPMEPGKDGEPGGTWAGAVPDPRLSKTLDQMAEQLGDPPAELNLLRYDMDETRRGSALNTYGCKYRDDSPVRVESDPVCNSPTIRGTSGMFGGRNPDDGSTVEGVFTLPVCKLHEEPIILLEESPRTLARLKRLELAQAGATTDDDDGEESETDVAPVKLAASQKGPAATEDVPSHPHITATEVMRQATKKGKARK